MGGIQSASAGRENNSAGENATHPSADAEVELVAQTGGTAAVERAGPATTVALVKQLSTEHGCETKHTAIEQCVTLDGEPSSANEEVEAQCETDRSAVVEDGPSDDAVPDDDDDGDGGAESDDSMAKCRARKMTAELATFRHELQLKREVHQAKLSNVRQELEYLRAALAEEKGRNRALIRYVQQQEAQRQCGGPREPQPGGSLNQSVDGAGALSLSPDGDVQSSTWSVELIRNDGAESTLEEPNRARERNASEPERERRERSASSSAGRGEQRDESRVVVVDRDESTTTPSAADDDDATRDERLALKRELAESQHELQRATGDALELRQQLAQLRTQLHAQQDEALVESARQSGSIRALKAELAESQFQLQIAQAETLSLQTDVGQLRNQVRTLKDVIKAGKEIIAIREDQVEQLKAKLRQIEDTLQERELQIMSDDLRREYDRQLTNIRNLRDLYEERERVSRMERDNLLRQLELKKNELGTEQEKNKNLEALVESLQTDLGRLRDEQEQTADRLAQSQAETRQLQLEMGVVNQFISKFLLGMRGKPVAGDINIDKLAAVLEENRGLLIEMTKDESETVDTGSFLPRALYDLIAEVDEANEAAGREPPAGEPREGDAMVEVAATAEGEEEVGEFNGVQKASPEEIADKLPKVWRVLIELVNHQERAQPVPFVEGGESEECLKSVQTRNGPKTVVSVSKTYIKLKDLILEKKSLKKDTSRLRTLNSHLERRLDTQEKRLSAVSLELTKTWHLVGKMQRQHRQLHTQEQILRYHLQQKRRLLSELKEELEFCRLKWSAARQKNIESEDQWRSLKADFAARRKQDSLNNSGESGYSDEQPSDEDDNHRGAGRRAKAVFLANQPGAAGLAGTEEVKAKEEEQEQAAGGSKRGHTVEVVVRRLEGCYLSSSLTNIYQLVVAAASMRAAHSESDMKSLENVERANRFCNEKIEDLPVLPGGADEVDGLGGLPAVLRESQDKTGAIGGAVKKAGKKRRKHVPESAQDMFLRLMNLAEDGEEDDDDDDEEDEEEEDEEQEHERTGTGNDFAEGEYSANDSASELSEEELPVAPALSSEEQFQRKREARLQRMAELNSRLDRYSATPTPGPGTSTGSEQPPAPEQGAGGPPPAERCGTPSSGAGVLSEDEERYLQRRAERLERLEREAKEFRSRLTKTVDRGTAIAAQIDEIHSGFIARQGDAGSSGASASDVAPASTSTTTTTTATTMIPAVDLSCLTETEREYTTARAERLERLEGESQRLLRQMNQTVRRGSSLTTKLDMLHTRYGSTASAGPEATTSEARADEADGGAATDGEQSRTAPESQHDLSAPGSAPNGQLVAEQEHEHEQEEEDQQLPPSVPGPYLPMGPIELVLVSDEEVMDEVNEQLLRGSNPRAPGDEGQ